MEQPEQFENFWIKFGLEEGLTVTMKGPKTPAKKKWEQRLKEWCKREDKPAIEFSRHVARGYVAVIKNRAATRAAKKFVPELKQVTAWLNQYCYEEEFEESTSDLKRRVQTANKCECGGEAFGRSESGGWICRQCYLQMWKEGKLYWKIKPSMQPLLSETPKLKSETWEEWSIRSLSKTEEGRKYLRLLGITLPVMNKEVKSK